MAARDASDAAAPMPIHVLTGFLGSGKTTLLNRLLRSPELSDTAVIVNEFGEIPLDHLLIEDVAGETIVLGNGCLCCTVRTDLAEALIGLIDRARRGEIPRFRRAVIETTGLADPVPVLGTLESHAVLRHHVRRGLVVTTVDASREALDAERFAEALHQISAADRIVQTKRDLAPDGGDATRRAIRRLNPFAPILAGDDPAVTQDLIRAFDAQELAVDRDLAPSPSPAHAHDHAHADPQSGIASLSIAWEEPVDWPAFGVWLSLLLHAHGDRILRLKALLNVAGRDGPVFVNGVRHVVHRPLHLDRWPDADRRSRLVAILSGLDPETLRRSLKDWIAAA
jgi:G3E family GTPase